MKKCYEEPTVEIIVFTPADVIATSGDVGVGEGEDEGD
jgi:hypothetical protein